MTTRKKFSLVIIAAVLVLQFVIPTVQLFAGGANRWGWQMYSRPPERPLIVGKFSDGIERPIPFGDHVYRFRFELRYDERFAAELCGANVEAIRIEDQVSGRIIEHECND